MSRIAMFEGRPGSHCGKGKKARCVKFPRKRSPQQNKFAAAAKQCKSKWAGSGSVAQRRSAFNNCIKGVLKLGALKLKSGKGGKLTQKLDGRRRRSRR